MHFYQIIENLSKERKLLIFVDMDGVIASYDIGKPYDFDKKRPLITNINTLKRLNSLENCELYILSICKKNYQIKEKNDWLDLNAPFFKKESRIIISKENSSITESGILKANYLNNLNTKNQIILVDDDNKVLKIVKENVKNITPHYDNTLNPPFYKRYLNTYC